MGLTAGGKKKSRAAHCAGNVEGNELAKPACIFTQVRILINTVRSFKRNLGSSVFPTERVAFSRSSSFWHWTCCGFLLPGLCNSLLRCHFAVISDKICRMLTPGFSKKPHGASQVVSARCLVRGSFAGWCLTVTLVRHHAQPVVGLLEEKQFTSFSAGFVSYEKHWSQSPAAHLKFVSGCCPPVVLFLSSTCPAGRVCKPCVLLPPAVLHSWCCPPVVLWHSRILCPPVVLAICVYCICFVLLVVLWPCCVFPLFPKQCSGLVRSLSGPCPGPGLVWVCASGLATL